MSEPEIIELPDQSWKAQAACVGLPATLFYPENSTMVPKEAKAICWERCPVREQCLQFAIETPELHGLWGGLTPKQRRPLRVAYLKERGMYNR